MVKRDFQGSLSVFERAFLSSACFFMIFAISSVSSYDSVNNEHANELVDQSYALDSKDTGDLEAQAFSAEASNAPALRAGKRRVLRKKKARAPQAASTNVLDLAQDTRSISMSDVSFHINKQNILIEREMEILKKQLQRSSLRKMNMDFDAKLKKLKEDLNARIDKFEAEWVKYRDEVSRMNSQRELQLDREIQKFKLRLTQLNNKNLSKIGVDRGKNGEQDDYSEIGDLFEENDEWGLQDSSAAHDASSDEDLGACIHPENALSEEEAFQNIIRIVSVAQKSSSKITAILCRNALEAINSEYEDFKEATAKLNKERKILSISKALGSYNLVISKLDPVYGFKSLTYSDLVNHLAYNNRNVPKSEEVSISPEAASLKSEMNDFASRIRSSKDELDDELEEDVDDIEGAAGAANQVPRSVGEIKSPSTLFAFMKTQLKELADNYTAADKLLRANVINENIEKIENFEKKYDKAASTNDKARAILSAKKEYENIILSEYPDEKEKAKELRNEKSISHEIVLKVLNAVKQEGAQQTL